MFLNIKLLSPPSIPCGKCRVTHLSSKFTAYQAVKITLKINVTKDFFLVQMIDLVK